MSLLYRTMETEEDITNDMVEDNVREEVPKYAPQEVFDDDEQKSPSFHPYDNANESKSPSFHPYDNANASKSPSFHPNSPQKPIEKDNTTNKAKALEALIAHYVGLINPSKNPSSVSNTNYELEVRFGTKGIKHLTKNDYDSVVKTLKSFGFQTDNALGSDSLRVKCQYLDGRTGRFKMSNIRTEINGLTAIELYCRTNEIKQVYKEQPSSIAFVNKKPYGMGQGQEQGDRNKRRGTFIDFDDFNFRVSLQTEEQVKPAIEKFVMDSWRKSKKEFRYLNRVSFYHPDYPFVIDLSIVKSSSKAKNDRGFMMTIPTFTLEESNTFNNHENYEIEIEIDNRKLMGLAPGWEHYREETMSIQKLVGDLRKCIKFVLSGLQGTNYPVSYVEQQSIINDYMKLIWKENEGAEQKYRKVYSKNFIGPNSITLQLKNISPLTETSNIPNIRRNFVVTDKADGDRHLLYVSNDGKIYLINTNMDVKFTGAKTIYEDYFNSLLDGELIAHDVNGDYINLYAAFDIYYYKGKDVRKYPFLQIDDEEREKIKRSGANIHDEIFKHCRYRLLDKYVNGLNPVGVVELKGNAQTTLLRGGAKKVIVEEAEEGEGVVTKKKRAKPVIKQAKQEILPSVMRNISPLRIQTKKFYPMSKTDTIFEGCKTILLKSQQHLFEYETDGLIFTHAYFGVGSNEIGKAGPNTKITWENSFKWKPPQFNTIDFLVTTVKSTNGDDVTQPICLNGVNPIADTQCGSYKTIELRCGFNEKVDGYINPCQNIIDDIVPEYKPRAEDDTSNDYLPKRFYPTDPYDPNAGLCNIMLKMDDNGTNQMFAQSNEAFTDYTIVEFAYNLDKPEGWRWEPLRVRHDKTAKLRRGEREYGNAYKVCNENWKSIHPSGRITEDMLMSGEGIPSLLVSEDVYYNTPSGKMKTEALKNFHNLYVKKMLITGVSKQGDTLIDFACGKAGDLPKWIAARLSFVFGVDYSRDNLENRIDGACVRYLKSKKENKHVPSALFVHGNSSLNIKNGTALMNDKAKQITQAVFGEGTKNAEQLGLGVAKLYGKGDGGFNVSSCQFAIHYFFQNPDTLKGFLRNVAECTKLNGYFIGTAYDGRTLFNDLQKTSTGKSILIMDGEKKIWEIIKSYSNNDFADNSSSIGYKIEVYQESINQYISEYLVNFDYLTRLLEMFGFVPITKEEATDMGLPDATGMFSELFIHMLDEIKRNPYREKEYGKAAHMTNFEKKISFLNRYFVYKKVREVNLNSIQIDLGDYNEEEIKRSVKEEKETEHAVSVAREEVKKSRAKVKKLTRKLLLVPATEVLEEEKAKEKEVPPKKPGVVPKPRAKTKKQKIVVVEEYADEEIVI